MRLADWPRMPYLNEEVRDWIAEELKTLGAEELAVYALEQGAEADERRVLVATEIGLLDHVYAPFGSTARYRLSGRLYPWQTVRGVALSGETFRLWAHEHGTRWSLRLDHPSFEAASETPELKRALVDLGRICAVLSEPSGGTETGEQWPRGSPRAATPLAIEAQGQPAGRPAGDGEPAREVVALAAGARDREEPPTA
jgi:hypothetical protein